MKKSLTLLLSLMMILTFTMSAFAASPTASGTSTAAGTSSPTSTGTTASSDDSDDSDSSDDSTSTTTVTNAVGTTVTVDAPETATTELVDGVAVPTSASIATDSKAVLSFTNANGTRATNVKIEIKAAAKSILAQVTSSFTVAGQTVSVEPKNIVAAIDIDVTGFTSGAATVPLKVSNVKAGEAVYGIHFKNGVPELIPAVAVSDNVVIITTSSFSPFVLVKGTAPSAISVPSVSTDGNVANAAATDSSATAPKTAGPDFRMLLAVAAVFATASVAVAFMTVKRER